MLFPATIAGVDLYYRLVSQIGLLTPAAGTWILRLLGVAGLAFVAFGVFPQFIGEYRAMHGTRGVMQVDHCSASSGRSSTTWTCRGSFAGDDGSRIANVTVTVTQDTAPTSPYVVMVTSPASTRAYPPGGHGYVGDVIVGGSVLAVACLCLYWSFGGRRWRGGATAGLRPGVRLRLRT